MPPSADLRPSCPPVYNQGTLSSCTGNAIAGAIQFERMRQRFGDSKLVPSRLFIYYNERDIEGTVNSDSGAQIRDGIKSVASQGDCFETGAGAWPYVISKFNVQPSPDCYTTARKDRTVGYSRIVPTLDQLKGCLAAGYPFVFGFTVYESFESSRVAQSGAVSMPRHGERVVGGHAAMAVGYADEQQLFTVRNSWGKNWGMQGYFTIPYSYLTSPRLASDFWTIRLMSDPTLAATPRKPILKPS
jgi:C1A family cysteine protease